MVIFGGLEFVAAGYLVHRHHKHKKEKARLQAAEAVEQHHQYHNQQQREQYHYYHQHQNPRRHKTYPRPYCTNKPNPPPVYHYHHNQPSKPDHYNAPLSPHSPQSPQSGRPYYQQSSLDLSSIPVANGTPPDRRYARQPLLSFSHLQPSQNLSPVSPHQYNHPPQSSSTHLSPTTPTLPPRHHNGFYSATTPLAIASTPNLPQGYQANTGLSDDLDRMSIDGLEVYEPGRPHPQRVHFAGLPDEARLDEQNDPPPPYRP